MILYKDPGRINIVIPFRLAYAAPAIEGEIVLYAQQLFEQLHFRFGYRDCFAELPANSLLHLGTFHPFNGDEINGCPKSNLLTLHLRLRGTAFAGFK